ncbi:protein kinase domain-containing protein [Streptomyces sp. I05A-00742]|uniref:protein kinase domain-containing protein n=1 Tax=Streptomyces sp. I05A-00742 TaxID=2732853 RepID=UPI00148777BE|nr:PQQ-binding-like beta-propeller repeat protein [Streptomyces sp. I05A-00742]
MPLPLNHDDPQQLGPFRLVARLGGGGMGTVYLGRSAGGRTVAVKTVHPRFAADEAFRARFRLESDAARVIGGEYGAGVVDADPFAALPWFATEYVLGPPLDEAVELCGPLPERTVRALGTVLCRALGQLHRSDVVHRDLKPSNVLLTASGPKLIDFGVARAIGDDRLTSLGTAAGTPAYMSPEQAAGVEHTSAGDVFALAGVLLFAATGHGPFGGGQAADLLYRVRYTAPDLSGLPEALVPLLSRCLDKDPARRPGTDELAAQLGASEGEAAYFADTLTDDLLAEIARRATEVWRLQPHRLPVPPGFADAPTTPAAGRAGISRRRLLGIAGGSALVVAAAGTGGWLWWRDRDDAGTPAPAAPVRLPRPANIPSRAVWWTRLESADGSRPPLVVGDQVVVKSRAGLVALDAKSGRKRWTAGAVKQSHEFTTDGEQVYTYVYEDLDSMGLKLYAVAPDTGALKTVAGPFPELSSSNLGAELLTARDGVLYLVVRKGNNQEDKNPWSFLAVDLRTGKKLWNQPFKDSYIPGMTASNAVATLRGGHFIYARALHMDRRSIVKSRRVSDGREEWEWSFPRNRLDEGFVGTGQLATDDRRAYYASEMVVAVTCADGKRAWAFGDNRDFGSVAADTSPYGIPAVRDGVVYVAEGTRAIIALAADTGKLLWETPFQDIPPVRYMPPVVGKKYLYALASDGAHDKVRAIDLRSHRVAWSMDIPGRVAGSLTAHERAGRVVWTSGEWVCAIPLE